MNARAPEPPPLERRKVAEQIADALREAIVGGRLIAGATLPSEREMAESYSVNRSSVREALRRLEAWGLVEIRHGEGTRVRDFLLSADMSVLPMLFEVGRHPEPEMLRDLHEIRGMLFCWCAEQAALRADASSVARLDALAKKMSEPSAKVKELQELDYDFFEELVSVTGNRLLGLLTRVVRDVYLKGRDRFVGMYARGVFDPEHHRKAVAAIRKRDSAAAGAAMRAHATSALQTLKGHQP
jgi:GntR family transcriptional repressor for pyruvate dehydrogenase complex